MSPLLLPTKLATLLVMAVDKRRGMRMVDGWDTWDRNVGMRRVHNNGRSVRKRLPRLSIVDRGGSDYSMRVKRVGITVHVGVTNGPLAIRATGMNKIPHTSRLLSFASILIFHITTCRGGAGHAQHSGNNRKPHRFN